MEFPSSISSYADTFDIPFASCVVRCKFCNNPLNYLDLSNFDAKNFRLIWFNLKVFGICCTCTKASANFESRYYLYSLLAKDLLKEGVLCNLIVRCYLCLGVLGYSEKLRLASEGRLLHRIRKGWRGVCKLCYLK